MFLFTRMDHWSITNISHEACLNTKHFDLDSWNAKNEGPGVFPSAALDVKQVKQTNTLKLELTTTDHTRTTYAAGLLFLA